jgi:hypothetical protein
MGHQGKGREKKRREVKRTREVVKRETERIRKEEGEKKIGGSKSVGTGGGVKRRPGESMSAWAIRDAEARCRAMDDRGAKRAAARDRDIGRTMKVSLTDPAETRQDRLEARVAGLTKSEWWDVGIITPAWLVRAEKQVAAEIKKLEKRIARMAEKRDRFLRAAEAKNRVPFRTVDQVLEEQESYKKHLREKGAKS